MRPDEEDRESGVSPDNGSGSQEDRQLSVAMMFVGVAMMLLLAFEYAQWVPGAKAESRFVTNEATSPTPNSIRMTYECPNRFDEFLSISGGFELAGVTPLLLYFAGVALWAQATVANLTLRYVIMGVAIVLALAIFHYGEVLFWHKQVVFWGTIAAVIFFMFKTAPPTR